MDFGQTGLYVKLDTCTDMHTYTNQPCKTHEEDTDINGQEVMQTAEHSHTKCGSTFGSIGQLLAGSQMTKMHLCCGI